MVRFNGTDYFYIYNLQGDVVAMIDTNGTQVVEFNYDAWCKPLSKTGSMADTLGMVNPFRYRGYVYDEEMGLYYLRSGYYNPEWKRFVNADALISTGKELLDKNVFAYCNNCPTGQSDPTGQAPIALIFILAAAAFALSGCAANNEMPPGDFVFTDSDEQNCYGYAFEINDIDNPGDYALGRSRPSIIEKEFRTLSGVASLVLRDMQVLGKNVRIIESPNEAKGGEYVVALKTTTSPFFFDYHFARQLSDKTWADKPGASASRWNKIDGEAQIWDGLFSPEYDSDTVYFAVKEY